MKVYIEKTDETIQESPCTARELLGKLSINPDRVLVTKNNEVVPLDENLSETDEIEIISVALDG